MKDELRDLHRDIWALTMIAQNKRILAIAMYSPQIAWRLRYSAERTQRRVERLKQVLTEIQAASVSKL